MVAGAGPAAHSALLRSGASTLNVAASKAPGPLASFHRGQVAPHKASYHPSTDGSDRGRLTGLQPAHPLRLPLGGLCSVNAILQLLVIWGDLHVEGREVKLCGGGGKLSHSHLQTQALSTPHTALEPGPRPAAPWSWDKKAGPLYPGADHGFDHPRKGAGSWVRQPSSGVQSLEGEQWGSPLPADPPAAGDSSSMSHSIHCRGPPRMQGAAGPAPSCCS